MKTRLLLVPAIVLAAVLALAGCANTPTRNSNPNRWPVPAAERPLREPAQDSANAVAFRALSLVGTPYLYGGESPQTGFDCSGFVRFIYRDALGLMLARTAQAQSEFGGTLHRRENLALGDLVFFRKGVSFRKGVFFSEGNAIFHVGLYVGEGRFVHAPRTGKTVQLSSLSTGYWAERFALARRVL